MFESIKRLFKKNEQPIIIGKIEGLTKSDRELLKAYPMVLSVIDKYCDIQIGKSMQNLADIKASNEEIRLNQGYVGGFIIMKSFVKSIGQDSQVK